MLRITINDSLKQQKWTLQGRLAGEWVQTLRSAWMRVRSHSEGRKCLIDLDGVTSIDRNGEALLAEILADGAQCMATGVYTKALLKQLRSPGNRNEM